MAQFHDALLCATVATLFWGGIGWSIAVWLPLPKALRVPMAPTLGWAVHSITALPIFLLTGMTGLTVSLAAALPAVAAVIAVAKPPPSDDDTSPSMRVPAWAFAAAIVFACAFLSIILPKMSADGAALAQPVFDHAKIAMIDDIARLGVPAGNPFFEEAGGFARLFYYYLWHFSAAELVILTGASGWEADAGMTGFTALCSLLLMMGLAVWLGERTRAAGWALVVAATVSIRPEMNALLGVGNAMDVIGYPSGFGAWLFQMAWAPQHVASANCVVVAIFLLTQLARRQGRLPTAVLGLVAAAAFGSSTWVGGVTFPLAAAALTPLLALRMDASLRRHFLVSLAVAAVIAVGLAAPFLIDQFKASALRGDGFPIAVMPADSLGKQFSPMVHRVLKIPVYWTAFLFAEFAAFYPAALFAAAWLAKDRLVTPDRRRTVAMLAVSAVIGLAVGGLLMSTTAPNNDLAWRGVLPALLILVALTAAGLGRYLTTMRPWATALLLLPIGLAFVNGLSNIYGNTVVPQPASAQRFVKSTAMWAAVRRHAGIRERIANNPDFLRDMTLWPVNISWALLADRRSCYAGSDLALPFAPLTPPRRREVEALFTRVFAGAPEAGDVAQLRDRYNCDVVVLTPDDGAWATDPFANDSPYRLVETDPANWRIYRRTDQRL